MINTTPLRKKLLDLAFSGKLVKKTGEWKTVKLGEVCELKAGKNIKAEKIKAYDETHRYPCYGGNGIRGYVKEFNTEGEHAIIGRQGALCGNVKLANGKYYATEHAVVVSGKIPLDMQYVYWALTFLNLNQYATATAQPGLSVKVINDVDFPLPPLAEQRAIVSRLEELLALEKTIAEDATALDNLIAVAKRKILDLAVSGKLVPMMDEWKMVKLGNIADTMLGKMLNRNKQSGKSSKYLCTINIKWRGFDFAQVKEMRFEPSELEQYSLVKGDILICEGGDVGRCAVWDRDDSYPFQNSVHRVRMHSDDPRYIQLYLECLGRHGKIATMCSGVTIKHFTSTILKNLEIPLPPLAEQRAIVAKVEELFAVLDAMKGR